MADYISHDDPIRKKNLQDFHGKTPKEIKNSRWYHGTVRDFGEFKTGRAQAIFLTKNPKFANEFALQGAIDHDWDDTNKVFVPREGAQSKPNVMPVHVRAENPFDYQNKKHINALIEHLGPQLISDPFLMDMIPDIRRGGWESIESEPIQKAIKKLGHDSFFVNETGEKNLAVYSPTQIKSATGNRGSYDPTTPDITKAEGGAVDLSQYQDKTNFGLYSHAAEAAFGLPQAKGTPDQMKSMLMKQGVKPAEIEHSNYDDVFGKRPSVTKDELVQHFRQSMPTIKEHVLKQPPDLYAMAKKIAEENGENWHEMPRSNRDYYYQMVEQHATTQYNEPSKFDDYSMPGGENYREVLLQLERNENNYERQAGDVYRKKSDLVAAYDQLPPGDPRGLEMSQQIVALQREYNQLLDKANENQQVGFKSGHWDQPNVLAHLRMKDRTGPNGEKILHVDEIQSDWGQQGRGGNFQNPRANEEFEQYVKDLREKLYQENVKSLVDNKVKEENRPRILEAMRKSIEETSPEQVAKYLGDKTWAEFDDKREKLYRNAKLAPHGPYVTNTAAWTDLALKRALHEAASGGYDKMIFTPGEEQANRYDLSNYVNSIHAFPDVNGKIHLNLHDNDNPDDYPIERIRDIDPNELHKHVGKEVADRILSKVEFPKEKEFWRVAARSNGAVHIFGDELENIDDAKKVVNSVQDIVRPHLEIEKYKKKVGGKNAVLRDLDLKIGGEGMRHFYDKLVPKQLMEITKRHDPEVKIKPDVIDTPEGPKDVHAIDITPKLRESVLRGQKAFAEGGAVDDDGITAYHGSPHDFDKFDLSKIGTGEGAQAYGHGLYFAGAEPVAQTYRGDPEERYRRFSGHMDPKEEYAFDLASHSGDVRDFDVMMGLAKKYGENIDFEEAERLAKKAVSKRGHMYEVKINAHPDHFLDWDKPMRDQHENVQAYLDEELKRYLRSAYEGQISNFAKKTAGEILEAVDRDQVRQSKAMKEAGIPGIKYLDQGSRGAGEGTRNYVVFDDKLVGVKRKYARGGSVAA